jgi:hypothetical protein
MPDGSFLDPLLSTVFAGAACLGISFFLAHCFPSKEMLDADAAQREWEVLSDAVEREWKVPSDG